MARVLRTLWLAVTEASCHVTRCTMSLANSHPGCDACWQPSSWLGSRSHPSWDLSPSWHLDRSLPSWTSKRGVGFYINPTRQFRFPVTSHTHCAVKHPLLVPFPALREHPLWDLPVKILSLDISSFKNFSCFTHRGPSTLKSFSISFAFIVGHLYRSFCLISSREDWSHSAHCVDDVGQIERQDAGLALQHLSMVKKNKKQGSAK